jgi:hypothetical protein
MLKNRCSGDGEKSMLGDAEKSMPADAGKVDILVFRISVGL